LQFGPDLEPEDKEYLVAHKNSELMKILRKIFVAYREQVTNTLLVAVPEHLQMVQGQLRGITGCINLVEGKIAAEEDKAKQKAKAASSGGSARGRARAVLPSALD
jgi:hypothetical protein